MARRRRRSTYKRRSTRRRRSPRRRSTRRPSTRRSYRKRRSSSCRKSNTGYGYSYSSAACSPYSPSPYSWPSQKKNDLCNPCNPCSPYSMYNFAGGASSPFPKIEYPKIKLKGKVDDKGDEKEFSIDPMTFSMYANYYKGCLPKCGPC